jgi:hypothetical protein
MQEYTPEYEAHLIKLAETNIFFNDTATTEIYTETLSILPGLTEQKEAVSDPLTFMNGEKFPVRILYMTANTVGATGDNLVAEGLFGERLIQGIGLRMRFHDQFYMRTSFTRLANWGTHVTASSDNNSYYTSSHKTWRPVVLSARDSFEVRVKAVQPLAAFPQPSEDNPWQVTTTFTGIGIFSKRPYVLSGSTILESAMTMQLDVGDFKNDGAEPILITDVTHNAVRFTDAGTLTPVLPFVNIGIKQIGNGTNADWVVSKPGEPNLAPAPVWGSYSGRALVHRFPGQGLIWEPGEGITLGINQTFGADLDAGTFTNIALVGYIAIQ